MNHWGGLEEKFHMELFFKASLDYEIRAAAVSNRWLIDTNYQ